MLRWISWRSPSIVGAMACPRPVLFNSRFFGGTDRRMRRGGRGVDLSGVGFFCLCLVASFSIDLRGSGPDKGNEPSCWEASSLQQSNCNEHYTPRKTTHLARLLAAFVAETSTMGQGQVC